MDNLLFPHDTIRESQKELTEDIAKAIASKKCIITHAPTGLGKTAAALAPALSHALKNDLTVFFLTSRHTQHLIAIETLKKIKEKHNIPLITTDIIGKKWMCAVPEVTTLRSSDFAEYCRSQKEEGKCEFYNNTLKSANNLTVKGELILSKIEDLVPAHSEKIIELCLRENLCPYEMASLLAKKSSVIIADYNYIFNEHIRKLFFARTEKDLSKSIIIVDEGHNLPQRIREMQNSQISTVMLARAIKEATKYGYKETAGLLQGLNKILLELRQDMDRPELLVTKKDFVEEVEKIKDYDDLIADLEFIAEDVRGKQRKSYIGSVIGFLESWNCQDDGFARILSVSNQNNTEVITLSYKCLDPSIVTQSIIEQSYSTILMSGTLTPTSMYKDVLGFPNDALERIYDSPFPQKNRLCLVVPETTTKFTMRNEAQFRRIAEITADMVNTVPGNTAIFFPSYALRDYVNRYFQYLCKKTTIVEQAEFTKEQKVEILEKFKDFKDVGLVLLAVYSGSFGEGIDLPGDLLKAVIVVGLPLNKPDLETQQLIQYYNESFGKGWDYGYLFPAMNKCFQSAGRCIRTETDRGVIVFLDERFIWPTYSRCFPADWEILISKDYSGPIKEFFKANS